MRGLFLQLKLGIYTFDLQRIHLYRHQTINKRKKYITKERKILHKHKRQVRVDSVESKREERKGEKRNHLLVSTDYISTARRKIVETRF